jgi:Domain of unknown function (DUF4267)
MFLGVGSIVAPRVMGGLFGISAAENPASPFLARLFGIREIFMACLLFRADEDQARDILTAGVAVDAADGIAALAAGSAGYLPQRAAILSAGTAGAVAALGVLALREIDVQDVEWIESDE